MYHLRNTPIITSNIFCIRRCIRIGLVVCLGRRHARALDNVGRARAIERGIVFARQRAESDPNGLISRENEGGVKIGSVTKPAFSKFFNLATSNIRFAWTLE